MLKTTALLSSIGIAEAVAEKFGNLKLFKKVYFMSRATQGVLDSIKVSLEYQGLHGLFLSAMADCIGSKSPNRVSQESEFTGLIAPRSCK